MQALAPLDQAIPMTSVTTIEIANMAQVDHSALMRSVENLLPRLGPYVRAFSLESDVRTQESFYRLSPAAVTLTLMLLSPSYAYIIADRWMQSETLLTDRYMALQIEKDQALTTLLYDNGTTLEAELSEEKTRPGLLMMDYLFDSCMTERLLPTPDQTVEATQAVLFADLEKLLKGRLE